MKLIKTVFIVVMLFYCSFIMAQQTKPDIPRYTKVSSGYLMVLRQGDDIMKEIEKMATVEKIPSANFTGMGFVSMTFGFFNFKSKEYDPKEFKNVELASLTGSIAWQDDKVSIHAHGTVTDDKFSTYGGDILKGTVSTGSVEILVIVHDKKFERIMEQPLGANILCIGNCKN